MQALNTELAKVTSQIEKLSFYRDKLTTLISVSEQSNSAPVVKVTSNKRQVAKLDKQKFDRVAAFVSETVRRTNCTKSEAIDLAITKYALPKSMKKRLSTALAPSGMGVETHNKLFSGTRYA